MVGSCSDRAPSDQRQVWAEAGLTEAFAIPKELLHGLRTLHPDLAVHHVGDSADPGRTTGQGTGRRLYSPRRLQDCQLHRFQR